jgi:N-acetylmuramoyl-L-alanine amidase
MKYIVRHSIFCKLFLYLGCLSAGFFYRPVAHAQGDSGTWLKRVVIDPGHGGRDPGAVGSKSKEKNIVLDISLRLGKMIKDKYPDVEVIYTRKTDVFVELDARGNIANKAQANLFISIHANSVKSNKKPYGTETFVMGNSRSAENMEVAKRENSAILLEDNYTERYEGFDPNSTESYIYFSLLQNAHLNQSLAFAADIQEQLRNRKRLDRGVKQGNLLVLWKTAMPSVLVEVGFISNAEEEKYMNTSTGKTELATAIFNAFCAYKSRIEERSSFGAGYQEANAGQPDSAAAANKTGQAKPAAGNRVEFCVQIATSPKPVDTDPNNFKKHKNVERIQTAPESYKYIVGRTTNYKEAQETLQKVKADFMDAFVVGIAGGKIISAAEALKLQN